MVTVVTEVGEVTIPEWVADLESFRRWADTDDFPETGRIWYLKGQVWVDMSREQVFTHVRVKTEITVVLGALAKQRRLGLFLTDGVLLTNTAADISGKPDSCFASTKSLRSKRVLLVEGMEEGYLELEGSPDMVLEIVSAYSVKKDCETLRQAYWEAGIREYWLVDVRKEPLSFDILRHTAKGYVVVRKQGGWSKSSVFGEAFQLTQQPDALGHPEYTLSIR